MWFLSIAFYFFGDGITVDGPSYRTSYSLDIYNNDINKIVDDLIEVDGMVSNSRVYNNRAWNGRAGVSLAPVFGGPAYIFRNLFVNMENSTYKMNRSPSGLYIVHNTTIQEGDGMSSNAGWQNTFMKNNLVFSGFYCFQEYGLVAGSTDDWNHNGYYSSRAGLSGSPWFKWDNIRYQKIPELGAGTTIESQGIEVNLTDLVNVSLPTDPFVEVMHNSLNLRPKPDASFIDHGISLPNINDPYVFDGFPDLGAIELASADLIIGHDFENPCDGAASVVKTWNGRVSNNWTERKNWTPCGVPADNMSIIIPPDTPFAPTLKSTIHVQQIQLGDQ